MKTEIEKIQEEYKAFGDRIEALKNSPKFEVGKYIVPATHSEVEQHLIAEAKKRGFKEGVTYTTPSGLRTRTVKGDKFYLSIYGNLCCQNGDHLFSDGKWATILKDQPILIGGKTVEFKKTDYGQPYIKIGCKQIGKGDLICIKNIMELHGWKEVSFDETPATLYQINLILERLK